MSCWQPLAQSCIKCPGVWKGRVSAGGLTAAPAARCRNWRRGNFAALTLSGWPFGLTSTRRRCVRRLVDTVSGVSTLLLRLSRILTTPSFVPLPVLGDKYTDCRCSRKELAVAPGRGRSLGHPPWRQVSGQNLSPSASTAEMTEPVMAVRDSPRACYAACIPRRLTPARTSRPGIAPVCSPCSNIGVPATRVAS
jgi:hypothetical protein